MSHVPLHFRQPQNGLLGKPLSMENKRVVDFMWLSLRTPQAPNSGIAELLEDGCKSVSELVAEF